VNEQLVLRLPHKQFVFTLPKVLRVFFRHDKRLHGEISRLIYALVHDLIAEAAGRPLRTAGILLFQTTGASWPVPQGRLRRRGTVRPHPTVDLHKMSCCFRARPIRQVVPPSPGTHPSPPPSLPSVYDWDRVVT
jgi:hypothetical protein